MAEYERLLKKSQRTASETVAAAATAVTSEEFLDAIAVCLAEKMV